jgi:penicillin-binding protein 2
MKDVIKSSQPSLDRHYNIKITILQAVILILMSIIIGRLLYIQIFQYTRYSKMALSNKQQKISIPAYRGEIYLNSGTEKIVENKVSFSIFIIPNNIPRERGIRRELVHKISLYFQISTNKIIDILKRGRWNPYRPKLLAENVSFEKINFLAEHLEDFPGLIYESSPKREYKDGQVYSHIVGYIRQISEHVLRRKQHLGYNRHSLIGYKGIEAQYDMELRGKDGYYYQIVDAKNNVKKEIFPADGQTVPGNDISLTIDNRIQKIVYTMMQKYPGGCIVTKVATGEVLALYSYPSYDPNIFVGKVDPEVYNAYLNDPQLPFFNRVVQGEYPPSSIFKMIVSCAALGDNEINFYYDRFNCEHGLQIGPQYFKCEGEHGNINMNQALARSCNTYYYYVGMKIGPEKIMKWADKYFTLGNLTGIDLPYERKGRVPTRRWKTEVKGSYWWDGNTAHLSIGQGFLLANIVQLNAITAAIANDGVAYKPHILDKIISASTGEIVYEYKKNILIDLPIEVKKLKQVRMALRNVVLWGTGISGCHSALKLAGKTGTAENIQGGTHSWFTCYAPYNSKKIEDMVAVTVFIEHGGHGSDVAAPFATAILEGIFQHKNPKTVYKRIMQRRGESKAYFFNQWLRRTGEKKLGSDYLEYLLEKIEDAKNTKGGAK